MEKGYDKDDKEGEGRVMAPRIEDVIWSQA